MISINITTKILIFSIILTINSYFKYIFNILYKFYFEFKNSK